MNTGFKKKSVLAPLQNHILPDNIPVGQLFTIQFGNPHTECRNFGICRVDNLEGQYKPSVKTCPAKISLLKSGGIKFRFFRQFLLPETEKMYFGSGWFLVEADYLFPRHLFPDAKMEILVKKGLFEILISKDFYTIIF